jgi:hypothetical protein
VSGVLYPDLARSFALGSQLRVQEEERGIDKEVNELVPAAMKGDQAAIENIARKRPNVAMGISGMLEKMDAGRRAKVKEASEWTAKAAMGVLSLPEAERPAAYQAALAEGQRLGYQIDMPPQYDRAVDGRLRQILNQTRTFENYWKDKQEGFDLVPSGGGGAAPPSAGGGGGVNPYNIGNVRPVGGGPNSGFQQPASLDDGIRLAVNNVKAYPAKFNNGQPMTLMQIGARWAPVGDGANDPGQWARNVASIGGLDPNQPLDLNDPMTAAKFARGVHGAEHGANKVLPPERYAQAITGGAAPPGIAQGDTAPPADASGTPIPTSDGGSVPREVMRMITPNLPPGTSLGRDRKTGLFKVQEGNFVVYDSNRNPVGLIPIPKPKEPGAGPFTGTGTEAQALNMLIANGTLTPQQAAELAAGKTVADPETKQIIFMTPSGIFGGRPGQPPQPITGPSPGMAAPAPMPSAGAPAGVPAPAAPAVTVPANPGSIPLTGVKPTGQPSATEMAKLRSARVEADKITAAANDFKTEWAKATPAERARSLAGANTPLNASYNNFALLAKGDALFQLGVLNGPDLDIIRRTIPDPSTWKSIMTSENDVTSSVDKVLNILNNGVSSTERQLGITPPQGAQPPQGAKPGTYLGPDNSPISWPEIEDTAKKRGITTDEVVNRLGLKPTGMQ